MGRKKSWGATRSACAVASSLFEQLETRSLFSTVSVADYGAIPDDGRDDASAVVAALKASKAGDTILFPGGTYQVSREIDPLGAGRVIAGENGATLQQTNQNFAFHFMGSGLTIKNLNFLGRGVFMDAYTGMVSNVTIDNCRFDTAGITGNMRTAVEFTCGLQNSTISNNTFVNISDTGIYGYYWNNLTIANNQFNGGNEGIHVTDFGHVSKNLLIEQNHFLNLHRMGIEYQGGGTNTVVQDNYYEKPAMTSNFPDNDGTFAYSIIADQSVGTIVRRNTSIAPERPDGVGVRIVIEIGGDNALVEQNYSLHGNHVLAANDANGTTSILAQNNRWSGYLQGPNGRGLTLINNGPNVTLNWDINRGIPGPNRRVSVPGMVVEQLPPPSTENTTPTPTPVPTPTPTPTPTPAPTSVFLSDLNWTSMINGWGPAEKDRSNGESGSADGRTLRLNGKTYAKGLGVHANSEIRYALNGKYMAFTSDIGIDDEMTSYGAATFQVWADGVKLYDSGSLNYASATKSVNVNVTGVQELVLKVDGGAGTGGDHADWANAQLTAALVVAPDPPPSTTTYLSDLSYASTTNGWGQVEKDRSNGETGASDGSIMKIGGVTYGKGLGVHSNSRIVYNLNGQYKTFITDIGVDDEVGSAGSVTFQIWTDGVKVYDSSVMLGSDGAKTANVSVAGKNQLTLVVTDAGNGNGHDHADWADARLVS